MAATIAFYFGFQIRERTLQEKLYGNTELLIIISDSEYVKLMMQPCHDVIIVRDLEMCVQYTLRFS